ncbi:MAG: hypothetical protein ACRCUS_08975 [Anaerovoracaceae bacterium]
MGWDEILDILMFGEKDEMLMVQCKDCREPILYSFDDKYGILVAECGCTQIRGQRCSEYPNCVEHFGLEYTFNT